MQFSIFPFQEVFNDIQMCCNENSIRKLCLHPTCQSKRHLCLKCEQAHATHQQDLIYPDILFKYLNSNFTQAANLEINKLSQHNSQFSSKNEKMINLFSKESGRSLIQMVQSGLQSLLVEDIYTIFFDKSSTLLDKRQWNKADLHEFIGQCSQVLINENNEIKLKEVKINVKKIKSENMPDELKRFLELKIEEFFSMLINDGPFGNQPVLYQNMQIQGQPADPNIVNAHQIIDDSFKFTKQLAHNNYIEIDDTGNVVKCVAGVDKIVLLTKILNETDQEIIFQYYGGVNEGDGDNKFGVFDIKHKNNEDYIFKAPEVETTEVSEQSQEQGAYYGFDDVGRIYRPKQKQDGGIGVCNKYRMVYKLENQQINLKISSEDDQIQQLQFRKGEKTEKSITIPKSKAGSLRFGFVLCGGAEITLVQNEPQTL